MPHTKFALGIAGVGQLTVPPLGGSLKAGGAGTGDAVDSGLAGGDVNGTRAVDAGDEAGPGISESDEAGVGEAGAGVCGCDHTGTATTAVSAPVVVVVVVADQ